jgi:hypothetical protein
VNKNWKAVTSKPCVFTEDFSKRKLARKYSSKIKIKIGIKGIEKNNTPDSGCLCIN